MNISIGFFEEDGTFRFLQFRVVGEVCVVADGAASVTTTLRAGETTVVIEVIEGQPSGAVQWLTSRGGS